MRSINLLIQNNDLDSENIIKSLSCFFKVSLVSELTDNTFVIDKLPHVDWNYISSLNFDNNINFVFLSEYSDDGLSRDKYIDSGLSFYRSSSKQQLTLPLAEYTSNPVDLSPVLFLDRDGIINKDTGYVYKYSDEIIFDDIIDVVKIANRLSVPVVIVTNQAGVARGMYTLEDVDAFHNKLCSYFESKGARINHIEVCPFHKDKGSPEWKFDSLLRKPNPGMHLKALPIVGGTLLKSLMIGDKESDRISVAGLNTLLLSGNYEMEVSDDVCVSRQELCEKISKYLNNLLDLS